ncbi:MAG TPA: type II CAAX endopeptidase family protein [Rhizomicrobium sp.]|nr:type II CAAX endopeptidase family protein [Rhizomicrobium sp.]
MTEVSQGGLWDRVPVIARAIVSGLLIGMIPANVWLVLLVILKLPVPEAVAIEIVFLAIYVWWARGGGPPARWKPARRDYFRAGALSGSQWFWGVIAAIGFAATVHAAIVLLFRFVPYPAAAFHQGYDMSYIPTQQLKYLACVVSALSAGVCEETGFRGYMQRPIENRHGPVVAVLVSSLLFMLLHLTKGWALIGMVPIVFGAGILLGTLARAAGTLWFGILGHWIMDIGLFAFWWTQIAGTFSQRPISETGMDPVFYVECAAFAAALIIVLVATARLRRLRAA